MRKIDRTKMRGMGKKELLVPYLDKYISSEAKPWEFKFEDTHQGKTDTAWHPSGDCTPKASELYAKAKGEKVEVFNPTGSLNKHMMVGHFWHQWLQHACLELGFCKIENIEAMGIRNWGHTSEEVLANDFVPKPYYWATGSADIAPLVLPKGWEGVVDFKSMNSASFKKDDVPFADKYECQINIYMDFFDLEKALMLGINKDSPHGFKEFHFNRNQDLIDMIYNKWKYVSSCLESSGWRPTEAEDEKFSLNELFKGPS